MTAERFALYSEVGVKKKKLLVLASTYPRWRGDYEPGFVHELSKRLVDHFDVTVLCPHSARSLQEEYLDQVHVVRYRYAPESLETLVNDGGVIANLKQSPMKILLLPLFLAGQILALRRLALKIRPDVLHAHWLIPQGLSAVLIRKFCLSSKVRIVVTSHGGDLFSLRGPTATLIKKIIVEKADKITVVSNAMLAELTKLGAAPEKLSVSPMGVDFEQQFQPDGKEIQESGLKEILFVGRLVEKKGLDILIKAMPAVLFNHPTAFLRVVGYGPQEPQLRALAKELEVEDYVRFVGSVQNSQLPSLYRNATVFAAPFVKAASGDEEGLGLVLVEALGCGCPSVVSDIPAARDITEGVGGLITVPQRDVVALSEALSLILDDPISFRTKLAHSMPVLNSRFSWAAVAQRYSMLLLGATE